MNAGEVVDSLTSMAALLGLEVTNVTVKRVPGLPIRVYDVAECKLASDWHTWELGIRSCSDREITFFLWDTRETRALLTRCGVKHLRILEEMQLWFDV